MIFIDSCLCCCGSNGLRWKARWGVCGLVLQVQQLRQQVEQARREEAAAKAVLSAAAAAARQMRSLSREEIVSIRQPILNPPTDEEIKAQREAEQQVCSCPPFSALKLCLVA